MFTLLITPNLTHSGRTIVRQATSIILKYLTFYPFLTKWDTGYVKDG